MTTPWNIARRLDQLMLDVQLAELTWELLNADIQQTAACLDLKRGLDDVRKEVRRLQRQNRKAAKPISQPRMRTPEWQARMFGQ
jgi:hypothetical protein